MNRRIIAFIALLCSLSLSLSGQTVEDSTAIVTARWETTVTSDNIVHKRALIPHLYKGKQSINLVEIPSGGKCRYGIAVSSMKPISLLAQENQALAAINGSFYNMQKGNSVCYLKIGKEVIDTTTTREFQLRVTGAVHVYKKKLRVLPWNPEIEADYRKKKGSILASGPLLLEDGETCSWEECDSSFVATKHPRSAVFTTKDKRTIFITVDGRSKGNAIGVSIPELAHLIRILGGEDALNLDGGGSTTLWMKEASDNGVVNYPSDNGKFDHEGERKIPNMIYVYNEK